MDIALRGDRQLWVTELEAPPPIDSLCIASSQQGLALIDFRKMDSLIDALELKTGDIHPQAAIFLTEGCKQLEEYLQGRRRTFDLTLDWYGLKGFPLRTLKAARDIPYGQVCTYGGLARAAGSPKAARAVGAAMAANPLPIVIPCHRVVASDGSLHGYSKPTRLDIKAWLLQLEGARLVA